MLLTGPGRVEARQSLLEPVRTGRALIRVIQCGLCASEIDQWLGRSGRYPVEIGHEVAGVVEDIAPDQEGGPLSVGDHVVSWVPGGGFTEFMVIETRHAIPVRPGIVFPAVAEPLACCVNAVELAAPRAGADVVIIGTGFMSLLIQRLSILKGARSVIVAGRRPAALARCAEQGATRVVDLRTESLADVVAADTEGGGADVTYEATGAQDALTLAGQATRTSGTIAIVGYHQGEPRTVDLAHWNEQAFRIANAHFRDLPTILEGMRTAIALVDSGRLDPSDLLTHRYPLHEISAAFRDAVRRPDGFIKAVIEPASDVGSVDGEVFRRASRKSSAAHHR
ncbi:zinc-binding dehydrogenase [Streptomyces sp. ME19-01-6]|uniref:zinc-binding dehydrogenase n=1 Tax=Streptomyces sp. ME19-01-6 TaxID=3028686 RepID=UPI0029A06506|nr:zinc-binding dehydrogenase [Streptomyces sp. ME19-01-6]MDX3224954.1 zinc-binding dehydrogenase [Streptomyces sp. ME19-01-6]